MTTLYAILADGVLVAHLGFVVFVVVGGFLALRWRPVVWLHLPCAIWGAYVELAGEVCPLTPLENRLRRMAGEEAYGGGFIERYVMPVLYPGDLTREIQIALGVGVIVLNAVVYAILVRRARRVGD